MIKTGKAGRGTYGVVYTAKSSTDPNVEFAVKRNIIDKTTDFSGSLKELDMLNRLKDHPFIVNLLYVKIGNPFPFRILLSEPAKCIRMTIYISSLKKLFWMVTVLFMTRMFTSAT